MGCKLPKLWDRMATMPHNEVAVIHSSFLERGGDVVVKYLGAKGMVDATRRLGTRVDNSFVVLNGRNSANAMAVAQHLNNGNSRCVVISDVASVGLDLLRCSRVFIMGPLWSSADQDQLSARCIRHGSSVAQVVVTYFVAVADPVYVDDVVDRVGGKVREDMLGEYEKMGLLAQLLKRLKADEKRGRSVDCIMVEIVRRKDVRIAPFYRALAEAAIDYDIVGHV
jgi:hypothetical protein